MPNGNPNFDRVALDRFFAPFTTSIERFAERRNLVVIKYYHEAPSWALGFQSPLGKFGFGKLSLSKSDANALELSAAVWVDDYDASTRRVRMSPPQPAPTDNGSLTVRLDAMLDDMLSWPLDEIFITHKHSWGSIPKAQWIAGQPKWPTPVRGTSS